MLSFETSVLSHIFSNHRSNKKIMIVGAHLEPEEPEEQALHLGVFKPKAGIREKLRETLHTVLEHEMAERGDHREEEEPSTIAPLSTVTISRNTRYGRRDTFHVGLKMHDRDAKYFYI